MENVAVAEEEDMNIQDKAYLFPREVLERFFSFATFSELKRFRLVCRDWNVYVTSHHRLVNCRAVFRSDWLMKARSLNFESTLKWKSVYFHYFPWKRNSLFDNYWTQCGQHVTILNFKFYKLPCTEMIKFLNSIPLLTELTLNQCSFETSRELAPNVRGQEPREGKKYIRSCCTHDNLELPPGSLPVPPPLIRVLKLIKADSFPLCLLDLLDRRTNGTLQVFHYDHARIPGWRRMYIFPTRENVQAFVIQIIRNNVNTLRDISFFRNFRWDLLLNRLVDRNTPLTAVTAVIGQQASWRFMQTAPEFIQFIDEGFDANTLERLTIRFIHRYSGPNLQDALRAKVNLRYLMVDTVWSEQGFPFNLAALFHVLINLETIHLRDRNRRRQPSMSDTYLTIPLPINVKSFAFYGYYIKEQDIRTFINGFSAQRLHSLMIEGGRYVTDETFQLIITTLPQLEVLAVNDSRYLTDYGVTGIPLDTVKEILKCQQRMILTGEFELDDDLPGVPVSQMRNLRKLSLAGCRKLSDITIFLGIKFPYLQEVDLSRCLNVTDIGIIHLSKHNPCLERIIIMKNLKITHFGLNQVLINNECIENIHTSKKIRDRQMGKQMPYTVCDRFATAVTLCHWDERRPRPMSSD